MLSQVLFDFVHDHVGEVLIPNRTYSDRYFSYVFCLFFGFDDSSFLYLSGSRKGFHHFDQPTMVNPDLKCLSNTEVT